MASSLTRARALPVVWIVDDSPTERAMTARTLGESAFELVQFADGSEAVERLATDAPLPDLVLLDWEMPGMTGDEVCRFVRANERTKELAIILITASRVETAGVVQGLAAGANDYVSRPFVPAELRARVTSVLRTNELANVAAREHARLAAINRLGRSLFQATGVRGVLEELVRSLGAELCDGCSLLVLPGEVPEIFLSVHREDPAGALLSAISTLADPAVFSFASSEAARSALPPAYHPYIDQFGLRGLAILAFPVRTPITGILTLTRDGGSAPFEAADLDALETCIEYASLAMQSALRLEAEQEARGKVDVLLHFQEQMLGIVSHDLRSPLSAILTGAELLVDMAEDPMVPPVARRIRSSAERMTGIVEQLLDVTRARIGSGIPVTPRHVELVPLVEAVVDELRMSLPKSRFELVTPTPVEGFWDPDRLGQVVSNLASNAAHYGRADAPVTITVAPDADQVWILVHNEIRDEPIPPARLAKLFDPFKRGDDAGQHTAGLGLGLYIVQEIVAAHHGTTSATSDRTGTTFRVGLPRYVSLRGAAAILD